MAEHSRGHQLVFLATKPRYHVVKLLETNQIVTVLAEKVKSFNEGKLKLLEFNGKEYHAVIFDSGEYIEMELTKDKLTDYEVTVSQYRSLGLTTQEVQTDTDITGVLSAEEKLSYTELQASYYSLLGELEGSQDYTNVAVGGYAEMSSQVCTTATSQQNVSLQQRHIEAPSIRPTMSEVDKTGESTQSVSTLPPQPFPDEQDIYYEQMPKEVPCTCTSLLPDKGGPRPKIPPSSESASEAQCKISMENMPEGRKKRQFCIYCKKSIVNLKRHLFAKHNSEERIRDLLRRESNDPILIKSIFDLRREGNALQNEILESSGGNVIPVRRGTTAANLVKCPRCSASYSKTSLFKHFKKCTGSTAVPKKIVAIAQAKAPDTTLPTSISQTLQK